MLLLLLLLLLCYHSLASYPRTNQSTPRSAFLNNITYVHPKVPTLYTALSSGNLASNPEVYGTYTHPMVLEKDQIVQINLNNLDTGRHPFHLHGHNFQAVHRSDEDAGTFEDSNVTSADFPAIPMRRDTFVLYPSGNVVLRFKANNPGEFLPSLFIILFTFLHPYQSLFRLGSWHKDLGAAVC